MSREVVMPDHPPYLQAGDAHRDYLEAKERGEPAAMVDRLRFLCSDAACQRDTNNPYFLLSLIA